MPASPIRNVSALLSYFGESASGDPEADEKRLSRRLYKSTACGAWAALIAPGATQVGTRVETWTGKFSKSIVGPRCLHVRKVGCKLVDALAAPLYVREFLLLGMGPGTPPRVVDGMTWEELRAPEGEQVSRVTPQGGHLFVTFEVEAPVFKSHSGGVRLGSIVEGSDGDVQPEQLLFPFTEEDLDRAIGNIESEADEMWHEANTLEEMRHAALEDFREGVPAPALEP